jgi:hypothetical protein
MKTHFCKIMNTIVVTLSAVCRFVLVSSNFSVDATNFGLNYSEERKNKIVASFANFFLSTNLKDFMTKKNSKKLFYKYIFYETENIRRHCWMYLSRMTWVLWSCLWYRQKLKSKWCERHNVVVTKTTRFLPNARLHVWVCVMIFIFFNSIQVNFFFSRM